MTELEQMRTERDRLAAEVARVTARWAALRELLLNAILKSTVSSTFDLAQAVAEALDALEREEAK